MICIEKYGLSSSYQSHPPPGVPLSHKHQKSCCWTKVEEDWQKQLLLYIVLYIKKIQVASKHNNVVPLLNVLLISCDTLLFFFCSLFFTCCSFLVKIKTFCNIMIYICCLNEMHDFVYLRVNLLFYFTHLKKS